MLFSSGDRFGGFSFYIQDNHLKYVYNFGQRRYTTVVSDQEIPLGYVELKYIFTVENYSAHVKLFINRKTVGEADIPELYFMRGSAITVKANKYTAVTSDYEAPYEYQGIIDRIIIHDPAGNVDCEETISKYMSQE